MSPVTLDRDQQRTVDAIYREARHVPRRWRKKFLRGAISTGLVEDNLHNSGVVRDHDSKNWRQERAQGYADEWRRTGGPLNLRASVRRYRQEFMSMADPGERAGDIAAQVQRPAAQYRGRYQQRIRSGEVDAIMRQYGRGVPGGGGGGGGSLGQRLGGFDPGQPAAAFAVQQGLVPPQSVVPQVGLPAPALDARRSLPLPERYQPVQGGGGPEPELSLADAVASRFGQNVSFGGGEARRTRLRREARARLGIGGLEHARTPEQLGNAVEEFARKELGIQGGSRDRTVASNRAAGGSATSDHLEEPGAFRGREGIDLPTTAAQGGWGQYRKMVRKLGGTPAANGFSQFTVRRGRKVFRVQVIFGDAHSHGDHIHVGFKRVR